MLFYLHYLDLYVSETALKVSRSLYCFITTVCHGVENYFPRLWGMGISDAILYDYTFIDWEINLYLLSLLFITINQKSSPKITVQVKNPIFAHMRIIKTIF